MSLYGKLDIKITSKHRKLLKRIIEFNPQNLYNRIKIDKYKRYQKIGIEQMFPSTKSKKCACGCGKALPKGRRRWNSDTCMEFAFYANQIIKGDTAKIKEILYEVLDYKCCKCGKNHSEIEVPHDLLCTIELDHIVAVKNGGGGCWLGNYQFICYHCHKEKTLSDRALMNKQTPLPTSNLFGT
jgi:5-methylcytosine-specific restriction endonuclease McrA